MYNSKIKKWYSNSITNKKKVKNNINILKLYINIYLYNNYKCLFYQINFREVILLNPDLIKIGKEMLEISKKLEKKVLNNLEKHNTLLQYYNESSIAKQKAIW